MKIGGNELRLMKLTAVLRLIVVAALVRNTVIMSEFINPLKRQQIKLEMIRYICELTIPVTAFTTSSISTINYILKVRKTDFAELTKVMK